MVRFVWDVQQFKLHICSVAVNVFSCCNQFSLMIKFVTQSLATIWYNSLIVVQINKEEDFYLSNKTELTHQ